MTVDRSLDEFATPEGAVDRDDERRGDGSPDAEAPAPPASTYVWHPDGGTCEACGERAEERWRDGDRFVCADCKEW